MNPKHDPDDTLLQQQLRAALAPDDAELEALNRRVLSQWRSRHDGASAQTEGHGAVRALVGRAGLRPWLIGATGLALGGALALGLWLQRPDPAMEELLQLDVLSQMAAGEM